MPSPSIHKQLLHPSPLLSLLIFTSFFFHPSTATDTITPTQSITDGQTLVSVGQVFELGFFRPGSSSNRYIGIWYKNIPDQTVLWVANRESPLPGSTGVLNLTADGNLALFDQTGHAFWSTNTSNATKPFVQLLDSGNLVLTDNSNNLLLWQSFDHPSNTLLSGMKLGWDLKTNLNRHLTSWKSTADPSPGPYSYRLDPHGVPEGFIWNESVTMCRPGTWNGYGFSGFPVMRSDNYFEFQFVANQNEVYYTYDVINKSIYSMVVLNQNGVMQRLVWQSHHEGWRLYWWFPTDPCDAYAECGSFGVCNRNDSLSCRCLTGFKPRSAEEWALREWSGGCVRRTALDCWKGDGFVKVSRLKIPDTSNSSVNGSMVFDECQDWCLRNCSCLAFAMNVESGCVIWAGDLIDIVQFPDGGEDLYVRLAAADLNSIKSDSTKKKKPLLILLTLFGILPLALVALFLWKRKRKQGIKNGYYSDDISGKEMELRLFDMFTIESATNDFSDKNILGEGGFGQVYMGKLGDGQEIAVKRLSEDSVQGLVEFKNEMMLIAKLQHRNLVRLLGCCIQGEERMLIYEYMPNKSLDTFIFDEAKRALLDWHKRLDIILGIARGLLYLHQDSRLKIIHRDLKASNILLDNELNPKISDFGTARIFKGDQMHENTKRIVGTYGYMSPEYTMYGIFSVKSDVFSFGVIMLEILSGKKNRIVYEAEPHMDLLGHAWRLWKEGKCLELLDEALGFSSHNSEILRCIHVALLCVQEGRDDRPTMSSVVLMLGSEDVALPEPKRSGFSTRRAGVDDDPSSANRLLGTTNEITVTMLEGR